MVRIPSSGSNDRLRRWNGGHLLAWRLGRASRCIVAWAVSNACVVCGRFVPMLYRRRVDPASAGGALGPDARLAEALARRSRAIAPGAAASSGHAAGRGLPRDLSRGQPRAGARSPTGFRGPQPGRCGWPRSTGSMVCTTGLLRPAGACPVRLSAGPTRDDRCGGPYRGSDAAHSIPTLHSTWCLTSETLEHVPDLDAALARDLAGARPRGLASLHRAADARSRRRPSFGRSLDGRGSIRPTGTPIRHPGGDVGYPVFTEFGADCLDRFSPRRLRRDDGLRAADRRRLVASLCLSQDGRGRLNPGTEVLAMLDGPSRLRRYRHPARFPRTLGALFITGSQDILAEPRPG